MTSIKELQDKLSLPRVSQVGVVVKDVERVAKHYSAVFGLEPFTIYEFAPDKHWFREEPSHLKLLMGKTMWGEVELELIQPLEGRSLHDEFLAAHGEGLQHLGINVRNYEDIYEEMRRAGFEPVMRAESYVETYDGYLKACYFDTRDIGGVLLEIIWKSWLPECQ